MTARQTSSATLQFVAGAISVMTFVGGVIGITLMLLFAVAKAEDMVENDQIVASFERELNRELPAAEVVTKSAIDDDILYTTVNTIHWSSPAEQAIELVNDETTEAADSSQESDADLLASKSTTTDDLALWTKQ